MFDGVHTFLVVMVGFVRDLIILLLIDNEKKLVILTTIESYKEYLKPNRLKLL